MEIPDPIAEREAALGRQLAGESRLLTAEEARQAVERARDALTGGYGVGFDVTKVIEGEEPGGVRLIVTVSDGTRHASVVAIISGSQVATLDARDEDVLPWAEARLYSVAGAFSREGDRYSEILLVHPLRLG